MPSAPEPLFHALTIRRVTICHAARLFSDGYLSICPDSASARRACRDSTRARLKIAATIDLFRPCAQRPRVADVRQRYPHTGAPHPPSTENHVGAARHAQYTRIMRRRQARGANDRSVHALV